MMDIASLAGGFAITAIMVAIGYHMRTVSHAILPLRDPFFLFMLVSQCAMFAVDCMGFYPLGLTFTQDETLYVTDRGTTVFLLMIAGDVGFIMGYLMCRPGDVTILDMPDESLTVTEIVPMVHYVKNGNSYVMPQTLGGILMSFLGVRHPLDMPYYDIARARRCTVSNGIRRPITVSEIPVSFHHTEEVSVGLLRIGSRKIRDEHKNIIAESPRYLLHPTVVAHTVRFAQAVTDDHLAFWVKQDIYRTAIEDAVEAEERAARLDIQMQSAKYDAGAELVAGLVSLSTDAPDSHEDILRRIESERKRRGESVEQDP